MRVKIDIIGREPFWMEVEPYYSFSTVKRKLEHLHNIPSGQQILYYNSKETMNYDTPLKELLVKDEDTFRVYVDTECFNLSCITPNHNLYIQVRTSNSIKELKQVIFKLSNICPKIQRIVINGIELEDECRLSDYNINSNSEVIINPDYRSVINDLNSISSSLKEMTPTI